MDTNEQQDVIISQLEVLNKTIAYQGSIKRIFFMGIIYGIGFFVGSAILATISLGILSPWLAEIDWIKDNFERGASLR